jgi:hypothetical protein
VLIERRKELFNLNVNQKHKSHCASQEREGKVYERVAVVAQWVVGCVNQRFCAFRSEAATRVVHRNTRQLLYTANGFEIRPLKELEVLK